MSNIYDKGARGHQQMADESLWTFSYVPHLNATVAHTNVTGPRGFVRQILFTDVGYAYAEGYASGTPEAHITDYERQRVHQVVGKRQGERGKFGSPQAGTPELGYRFDPPHPGARPGSAEAGWHLNWWGLDKREEWHWRSLGDPFRLIHATSAHGS